MRTLLTSAIALALLAPLTLASPEDVASVRPVLVHGAEGGGGALDAVSYAHDDCVGPGLPGTAGPHATHTTLVPGFVIAPSRPISVGVVTLALFGAGICPTALGGPVLPHDYSGRLQLTAVCRGTIDDGAVFLQFTLDIIAGFVVGQSSSAGACTGTLNAPFALEVTFALTPTNALGTPLGPLGGVRHTLAQA
ncbi:MAG TPA: hypothetical protein VM582_04345 [Candidatus Thermoplasmatota archaeon]|nr:hypothetical protein [Candidatus Thermoplasmatota archaeon]